jgi:Cu-processing system ATP-binding protein
MKRLSLENVSVNFGAVKALKSVSLNIDAGKPLLLVGPNGAGKSTLLKVLLGLVQPDDGGLSVDGEARKIDNSFRHMLGYLPEAVAFSENLSGVAVLRFFARARGIGSRRVEEALQRVGLATAARRAVRGYSRGMRQRLGLAVAIIAEPPLLVVDEPTGGLDQEGLSVLWSILADWSREGRMVVVSSHDLALLERHVKEICVLKSGSVLFGGGLDRLRRDASLPHLVRMNLAADSAAAKDIVALSDALDDWGHAEVQRGDDFLQISVSGDHLLELMDLRGKFPAALTGVRIAEPTLDMVYERLLEGNA